VVDENVEIGGRRRTAGARGDLSRGENREQFFSPHAHAVVREKLPRRKPNVLLQNGVVIGSERLSASPRIVKDAGNKIPQPAPVIIEDDVEIQANSCIDSRQRPAETRIRRGR